MLAKIGAAVSAERTRLGLGIDQLGVNAETVVRLEAGQTGITTSQLETIAQALQLEPMELRRGLVVHRARPSVFLRHNAIQDFDAADAEVLDTALEEARARNSLARLVGEYVGLFPGQQIRPQPIAGDGAHAPAHQGYQLARDLRARLQNETRPIDDLRELAEIDLGVTVLVRGLLTLGASAISVKAKDAAAIVLTPSSLGPHVRVWIAHEICHLFFDPDAGGVHVVVDYVTDHRAHQAEQRARAFAAEFLVPSAGLRELFGDPKHVEGTVTAIELTMAARERFGATWQVTANHVCNQGFVDLSLRAWLEQSAPAAAHPTHTTVLPMPAAASVQVSKLTRKAHDAGLVTDAEARGLLLLDGFAPLPWDP